MVETQSIPWRNVARNSFFVAVIVIAFAFATRTLDISLKPLAHVGAAAAAVPSPFIYNFSEDGILEEAGNPGESASPYWWLDSGGELRIENGVGKTVHEALPAFNTWRLRYALSSAEDTENGQYPQNLFRLLTRADWDNVRAEVSFKITADTLTNSPSRNESNGLLLMSRYQDGDTLYYMGLRVDGHAVIKKKYNDAYYTMAEKEIFPGEYDRDTNPNLLPHHEWLHLRSETTTKNNIVAIKLFLKREGEEEWSEILVATDEGQHENTPPIIGPNPLGIRTDFMDVEFDNFRLEKI